MRLGVIPVGIETVAFHRLARVAERCLLVQGVRSSLGESRLILGVDRIDCSKGILHRMKAFERFLEISSAWLGKATLLQVTPPRGPEDKRFCEIEAELAGLITKINGRFGDAAWTPIRYVNRSYSRGVLAGICRLADAALVTPLRDGMNLVAKEFVAAQDPRNPGVLVLSQFAGSASELDNALIVNPHEIDSVAVALKRALEMPLPERRERHATMLKRLMDWDIDTWAESYLSALVKSPPRRGGFDDIRLLRASAQNAAPTKLVPGKRKNFSGPFPTAPERQQSARRRRRRRKWRASSHSLNGGRKTVLVDARCSVG
jgi:trehalose 6-phosphate synthase